MKIELTVIEGFDQGRTFGFEGHDTFLLGRSRQAHFQLPAQDLYCSRIHFMMELNPPHCRIVDMGSNNGTFVNDRAVESIELHPGDVIRVGRTRLRVRISGSDVATKEWTQGSLVGTSCLGTATKWFSAGTCLHCRQGFNATDTGPYLCVPCITKLEATPQPFPAYLLIHELGQGGIGPIHLALRRHDQEILALTAVRPPQTGNTEDIQAVLDAVSQTARLKHHAIVPLRDCSFAAGSFLFASDYLPCPSARMLVQQDGPLATAHAIELTSQMLEGLEYAHDRGFIHGDIKPGNLLVGKQDEIEFARLADFGIAQIYRSSPLCGLTLTGQRSALSPFLAPEQIREMRTVRPTSDQYSAAALLYFLLTGCYVYEPADDFRCLFLAMLHDPPVSILQRRPDLPGGLADIIHRALERDPQARFVSVTEFLEALSPFSRSVTPQPHTGNHSGN